MSEPDQRIRIELERRGFDWTGTAFEDPVVVHRHGPVGSPGEVLDELALPLDAAEAERVVDAKTAERAAVEDLGRDDELELAWRRETGSTDPQGPPVGWRPRRQVEP